MLRRVLVQRPLLRAPCARAFASSPHKKPEIMRDIHFERDPSDDVERPFAIVGVRDVEVLDWEYPARVESENKRNRTLRNRFGHPNFISLWVDKLAAVEPFLQAGNVPYSSEGVVRGPEGHDVLVIEPSEGGVEFFNLCDNPTLVELVQAPPEVIEDYLDGQVRVIEEATVIEETPDKA
ncbi:hypothetical protein PybrP1_011848 [[Pythium] brassicae (nom. inval.)]|nr:hypothetical protein PybrP1_011848 [[Pythium] brassicae (nom. inval.)]